MSFFKIINAFHTGKEELLDQAIDLITDLIINEPEEIDDLVAFAIANLKEEQFLFLFSIIEDCAMSISIDVTKKTSVRFSLYFIVMKAENIQDSDPENVNEFRLTPTLKKFKLLKNKIDQSFFVPSFKDAKQLSQLPIADLHLYFRDTMESIPYLPTVQLHKSTLLKQENILCLPLIIQEKESGLLTPNFGDHYNNLSVKKKILLNKEISLKFNKQKNKYQVLDIIPALDVKGLFYEEDNINKSEV